MGTIRSNYLASNSESSTFSSCVHPIKGNKVHIHLIIKVNHAILELLRTFEKQISSSRTTAKSAKEDDGRKKWLEKRMKAYMG